ncbi:hypothetical protein LOTGIDRAFT_82528, partial [Lottia gigantea]
SLNLTILHTNDVHARFEQTNKYSSACSEQNQLAEKCYGGYARLIGKVKDIKMKYPNSIVLDGGDQFQGTTWFYKYGGNVTAYFMNLLGYDAMAIGNHEFDNKVSGLIPFLEKTNFNVLSSNIDASKESMIEGKFKKSTILDVGGEKVAVIGYTTVDTPSISSTAAQQYLNKKRSYNFNSLIQLHETVTSFDYHGYNKDHDVNILSEPENHIFLYELLPFVDLGSDRFTTSNRQCCLLGRFAKKVKGIKVARVVGRWYKPILDDAMIWTHATVLNELKPWREEVDGFKKTEIGETRVFLEGDSLVCRRAECNLGNAIVDGMLRYNLNNKVANKWNNVSIVLLNSGGIRAPIDQGRLCIITVEDVLTTLPFRNTISLIDLKGDVLVEVLEHSVGSLSPDKSDDLKGRFLQFSGLRVKYNLYKSAGNRVVDVKVLCTECRIPTFEELDLNKYYRVILGDYIAGGGDGYEMIKNKGINYLDKGDVDNAVFNDYLKKYSPIIQGLDGRIEF